MKCPTCHQDFTKILETRDYGNRVRRRRECPLGHRFKTIEKLAPPPETQTRVNYLISNILAQRKAKQIKPPPASPGREHDDWTLEGS